MSEVHSHQRHTKIVATLGPASGSPALIESLIQAGMNVARLNLSHGSHSQHRQYFKAVRSASHRLKQDVAVLMDLPGPKYRTGPLKEGEVFLKKGAEILLVGKRAPGDAGAVSVTPDNFADAVNPGDAVLLDDGALQLRVTGVSGGKVVCRVRVGGRLTGGRGVVVPGMDFPGPFITPALIEHLCFAARIRPDFLAVSFVAGPEDISAVRAQLAALDVHIPLIAKIERGRAVRNFKAILEASDGIMVARGDLGVDIPLERIPVVQKDVIRRTNRAGKPVITATQMLESMIRAARPTRAEVTDVANAILDGTDATMLSGETSMGRYPLAAVRMMARITETAEQKIDHERLAAAGNQNLEQLTDELIAFNACHTAAALGSRAIVALTESGGTARRVAKYRPQVPVLAITPRQETYRQLVLTWGVRPFRIGRVKTVEELFRVGANLAREEGLAGPGDTIVVTGGIPLGVAGGTNLLKVETVG